MACLLLAPCGQNVGNHGDMWLTWLQGLCKLEGVCAGQQRQASTAAEGQPSLLCLPAAALLDCLDCTPPPPAAAAASPRKPPGRLDATPSPTPILHSVLDCCYAAWTAETPTPSEPGHTQRQVSCEVGIFLQGPQQPVAQTCPMSQPLFGLPVFATS